MYHEPTCSHCGDNKKSWEVDRYNEWVLVPCPLCERPPPKNFTLKPPKKIDNSRIETLFAKDGRVFVDPVRGRDHRGGPEYPRHFCRFEEYGLEGGLVRCRKCGMVRVD